MSKLPKKATSVGNNNPLSIETVITKADASDELERILERAQELEEIMLSLQPLLATISEALYGEDDSPVPLAKLIEDACAFINGREGTLQ